MYRRKSRHRDRLSVGRLEDLTLSRIVSQQLLDQVDVGEQHAAAAVTGKAKIVKRFSVRSPVSLLPKRSRLGLGICIPLSLALTTVGVDELDVFGPEVTDDLFACVISLCAFVSK